MGAMATTEFKSRVTEQLVEELRAAHPTAKGFERLELLLPTGETLEGIAMYPPSPAAWSMYREKLLEPTAAEKASASRILFNAMIVWPPKDELKDMIHDHPGVVESWVGECNELVGVSRGTRREKL